MAQNTTFASAVKRMMTDLHAVLVGQDDSAKIVPYLGYGNAQTIHVRGRVHRRYNVPLSLDTDSTWRNFMNTIKRFNSHELPFARISAAFNGASAQTDANDEGYFQVKIDLDPNVHLDRSLAWHTVTLNAPDYIEAQTITQVLIPPDQAQFGVISDLDDTVIQSDVLNIAKLVLNTFFLNAHTRLPFAGVAQFYKALQAGTTSGLNPIFYVSNSPWNLYDVLTQFFEIRGIPVGPLFMTDIMISPKKLMPEMGFKHKLTAIEGLLTSYPHLPFILIGDSGEHDAAIYAEAVRRFQNRIAAIYIRNVRPGNESVIQESIDAAAKANVDMLLVPDTVAAAEHAAANGFITPEAVAEIHREKKQDQI